MMKFRLNPPVTIHRLSCVALVFGCVFGIITNAAAQNQSFPVTPGLAPPVGNLPYLEGHALGTQGYVCLPGAGGTNSWTVNSARPEATLTINVFGIPVQIITHFASLETNPNEFGKPFVLPGGNATWQSSFDTSRVWAVATKHINAGTDENCSHDGSIACLLLQSIGNQRGPTGGNILAKATFVQRLNTQGGSAPTTSCTVGQTVLVPYSADYVFFRAGE